MVSRVFGVTALLTSLVLLIQVSAHTYEEESNKNDIESNIMYLNDEELIRQMHSIMNAYKEKNAEGGQFIVETNSLVNTKFKTWKRNADLINALLALPKGMTDAGR